MLDIHTSQPDSLDEVKGPNQLPINDSLFIELAYTQIETASVCLQLFAHTVKPRVHCVAL